ncbi:toll/interleukin-1 receptor domain-containing protein [Dictyobacter kobayashii]|uniref:TIR domain-containing protein n=1 Tax=Dictyobacter kobayashii TaxID=2014872 RepID=A0A402ACF0_9CHLR|nr:toll/interleukin-1 receptor domain-containing protein [Dictyobacter kobayashii]GCE16761.1 hypothetical protein KDK_05610 [Dictyobacter kobayashii]
MKHQSRQVTLSVYYSYASSDEYLCNQLSKHLAPLVHIGIVKEWFEYLITPGKNYAEEKRHALEASNLILLLISSDYLASDECFREMRFALEHHRRDKVQVVPIILRPCLWDVTLLLAYTACLAMVKQ